jgi:hypothetical protein
MSFTAKIDYHCEQNILRAIKQTADAIASRVELKDGKYAAFAYSGDWNKRDAALLHKLTVLWTKYQMGEVSDEEAHDAYLKLIR